MPSDRWSLPIASLRMFQVSLRVEQGRSIYVLISLRGQHFMRHKSDSRLEDTPRTLPSKFRQQVRICAQLICTFSVPESDKLG